jgi:hypothetical protein
VSKVRIEPVAIAAVADPPGVFDSTTVPARVPRTAGYETPLTVMVVNPLAHTGKTVWIVADVFQPAATDDVDTDRQTDPGPRTGCAVTL